ncbi:MAG: hypothetical protein ACLR1M_00320 [Oscillospiraceae bacterium]
MRTKRVLRAAVAFLFAFGVLAADLALLRLRRRRRPPPSPKRTSTS